MSGKIEAAFDGVAGRYDSLYTGPVEQAETRYIGDCLRQYVQHDTSILDVGCGTGLVLDVLDNYRGHYVGIDLSEKMLDEASRKHPAQSWIRSEILQANIPEEGSWDLVTSLFSLNYSSRPDQVISRMRNALKPGGRIFVVVQGLRHKTLSDELKQTRLTPSGWGMLFSGFSERRITGVNTGLLFGGHNVPGVLVGAKMRLEAATVGRWFPARAEHYIITGVTNAS